MGLLREFYGFLVAVGVLLCVVFSMCVIILSRDRSFKENITEYPITIVLIILCVGFKVFVIGMLGLHTYLSLKNVTTY